VDERKRKKVEREFKRQIERVTPEEVERVLKKRREVEEKVKKGTLRKFLEEVKLFFGLLADFLSGRYREVPWYTVAAVAAALLYTLNPLDAIPDFIPVVGQVDDALVITLCLALIEEDLNRYREWKRRRKA